MKAQHPAGEPTPTHVASFDVYRAALDTGFLGADMSTDVGGNLRFNTPAVFGRDIRYADHSERQAMQLMRDVFTYTAKRIEVGEATSVAPTAISLEDGSQSHQAAPLGVDELDALGLVPGCGWEEIRPVIAQKMVDDFAGYRDSLVDGLPRTADAMNNVERWASVASRAAAEVSNPVGVYDYPRLLPGVEPIGVVVGQDGTSQMRDGS